MMYCLIIRHSLIPCLFVFLREILRERYQYIHRINTRLLLSISTIRQKLYHVILIMVIIPIPLELKLDHHNLQ